MTPFEQFIAREYKREKGAPIDDIYDEARARWKQTQATPMDANAQAAQGMFASLPDPAPAPSTQLSETMSAPPPARNYGTSDPAYGGMFDLASNRTMFDDLPDTQPARQSQLTELEIAQRQASGAAEANANPQPKALPDELVNTAWRMFADEYRDFKVRTDGPMKSEPRTNLINEWSQGFSANYAPVLGVTLAEAEALARNAAKENRPIGLSDWKKTAEAAAQELPPDEFLKVAQAAEAAEKITPGAGRAYLEKYGAVKPRNVYDDAQTLIDENRQLQVAQKAGYFTKPDGTMLNEEDIGTRLAENTNKLVGLRPALAMAPSEEGRFVNINQLALDFKTGNSINVSKLNKAVAEMAEKNPGLIANMDGNLIPAAEFKYTIPKNKGEEAAPPEEKTTETLDKTMQTLGRGARAFAPMASANVKAARDMALAALNPVSRVAREAEFLKEAVPYARGAVSGLKRGFFDDLPE